MKGLEHILLTLTAAERWEAARQLNTGRAPGQGFTLLAVILLVVLLTLLIWSSYTRWQQRHSRTREVFTENAFRRGLAARDRQILLAVVMRSGLRRTQDVFNAADAFDQGAVKLLAECGRTRTPQENECLRAEISRLREKLGFQIASPAGRTIGLGQTSSREIPAGRSLELIRQSPGDSARIQAQVVRNDEIELAVGLTAPVVSIAGELWRARYYSGLSAWEFDTSTVSCDGRKLVLNHSDAVHFINRRRFPRVPADGHALIARLPFRQNAFPPVDSDAEDSDVSVQADEQEQPLRSSQPPALLASSYDAPMSEAPVFVESRLTELAGPGLRIETCLRVQPGDRVLVVFTLNPHTTSGVPRAWGTITGIGRVRHCRPLSDDSNVRPSGSWSPMSIAVELLGLTDAEIDELAYVTAEISAREENHRPENRKRPADAPAATAGAVLDRA